MKQTTKEQVVEIRNSAGSLVGKYYPDKGAIEIGNEPGNNLTLPRDRGSELIRALRRQYGTPNQSVFPRCRFCCL